MKIHPAFTRPFPLLALASLILLGSFFRLSSPGTIEFKADEIYHFEMWKGVSERGEAWPAIGSLSSANMRNPGLSVWIYLALGKVFQLNDPISFNRYTQVSNVLALLLLAWVILKTVRKEEQSAWIWALAFAAVNPMFVIQGRKMWHPAFMPLASTIFFSAILNRRRPFLGAFLLGLSGIVMGQIHMSGFFFVAGVLAYLFFTKALKPFSFRNFAVGAILGAIPLYSWIHWLLFERPHDPLTTAWHRLLMFRFWNFFLVDTWGVTAKNALGSHFKNLLAMPAVAGHPTYLIAAAHLALLSIGLIGLFRFFKPHFQGKTKFKHYFNSPAANDTGLLLRSVIIGGGVGLTLSAAAIQHHHILVAFPISFLAFAVMIRREFQNSNRVLLVAFISQCLISFATLSYLNQNGGAPGAQFGDSYERQLQIQKEKGNAP